MTYTTLPEYLTDLFTPLKYLLLAYVTSGSNIDPEKTATYANILGVSEAPETPEAAWDLYAQEEEKLAARVKATTESGVLLPFERICQALDLNPFERVTLALVLAAETDPLYNSAILAVEGRLTLSLLLRLFSANAEENLYWQAEWLNKAPTLRSVFSSGALNDPLALGQAAKKYLLGVDITPTGAQLIPPDAPLPEHHPICPEAKVMRRQLNLRPSDNVFIITGPRGVGKKYQVKRCAQSSDAMLLLLPYENIQEEETWLNELRLILTLTGAYLCVSDLPEEKSRLERLNQLLRIVRPENLFLTGDVGIALPDFPEDYSVIPVELPIPDSQIRLNLWHIQTSIYNLSDDLEEFAARYRFTPGQIAKASQLAHEMAVQRKQEAITSSLLHQACRRQFSHALGALAVPVSAIFTWEDLILPPTPKRLLRHICDQVRFSTLVNEGWGFGAKMAYGRGVRALFSGPPGTGKTMAAQVIARELHMDLYKIDLSSLVSKYIGETEKNINEVFIQAAKSGGILFFDEADAIFGKRGEQKDSHDKYANMQTAFLLQRFEDYDGVVLLATNLIANLDPAFSRRIQNRVDFPTPSYEHRKGIWESLLIKTAPFAEDIDLEFLAKKFELTGAAIKNIVLQAAFLAAGSGSSIGMEELVGALVMEYAKTDKIISRRDLGEYAYYWAENQ